MQLCDPYLRAEPLSIVPSKNSLSQNVASEALMGFEVQTPALSEKLGKQNSPKPKLSEFLAAIQLPQSVPVTPVPRATYGRKRVRASAVVVVLDCKASAWSRVSP